MNVPMGQTADRDLNAVDIYSVTIHMTQDKSSALLLEALHTHKTFPTVKLSVYKTNDSGAISDWFTLELQQVNVVVFSANGHGDGSKQKETIELAFTKYIGIYTDSDAAANKSNGKNTFTYCMVERSSK